MRNEALAQRRERDHAFTQVDFDRSPFTIAWELTRACAYSCWHCRASAQPKRDPNELSKQEGFDLIRDLAKFGTSPILVITGGDPLMRPDVFELARYADNHGLRVSLTPTATALVTAKRMQEAKASGIRRVAFSIDAAEAQLHDSFRGFSGSFERTLQGIEAAKRVGLSIQVNTTVTKINAKGLVAMPSLMERMGVVQWSVFFLVRTGRGAVLEMVSPSEHEDTLNWLYDLSLTASYDIKATAAPQYRRIVVQRSGNNKQLAGAGFRYEDGLARPRKGVNDGRGFMFISHKGDVYPSGFLPVKAGNVRQSSAVDIYRDSDLFRSLRDSNLLKGKCGCCEFQEVCGGSRARAFATTGDYLESDTFCPYVPQGVNNGATDQKSVKIDNG